MTEEHDVDQRDELPEEAFPQVNELRGDAIDESNRNCQGDERHHTRLAILELRDCHLQEWDTAVGEDDHRKHKGDPLAERERRRGKPQPHLDHLTIEQDGDAQKQTPPEADPEHLLMPCLVRAVSCMGGMIHVRHFLFCWCGGHGMSQMCRVRGMVFHAVLRMIHHLMLGMIVDWG